MRLIEVELNNICQFKHFYSKFEKGQTAILGPNGSGKSNLLASIYAGITDDFSRFGHTAKQGVVCQYANPKDLASIRLVLEHNGSIGEITRSIKGKENSRSLVINNGEPITAAKAVSAKIEEWFGLPLKVIGQYIFVDQWQMFSILEEQPSVRAKDLYRLFGIDQSEVCWNACGDRLSELANATTQVDVETIRYRLLSSRNQVRELSTKLVDLQLHTVDQQKIDKALAIINACNRKLDLESNIQILEEDITKLQTSLDQALEKEETAKAQVDRQTKDIATLSTQLEAVKTIKKDWENFIKLRSTHENLITLRTSIEKEYRDEPNKPEDYIEENDPIFTASYYQSIQLVHEANSYVSRFKPDDKTCPTCGTEIDVFIDKLESYKDIIATVTPKIAEMKEAKNRSEKYRDALSQYRVWSIQYVKRLADIEAHISALPDNPKPDIAEANLSIVVGSYNNLTASFTTSKYQLSKCQQSIAFINGQLALKNSTKDKLIDEYDSIIVTDEELEVARAEMEVRDLLLKEQAKLQTEISIIKRGISDDEVSLEDASDRLKQAQKIAAWKEELVTVRDIMHREALPKCIAQSYLDKLESQMNTTLIELGVDFKVKTKDDLRFQIIFNDKIRSIPAEALSGGEKVMFALAWRLAVNAEFAADIGLLCLDEPTAGLDKDRLGCLKQAIGGLKNMAQSKGLQCIIITHEEGLRSLFDSVIEIFPPSI